MKGLILACAACGLLALPAAGQRGGAGHGGGFGHPGTGPGTTGIPPLGSLPALGTQSPQRNFRQSGQGFGYWLPLGYDESQGNNYPYQASPSMLVVVPQAQPAPPPRPVQGEVHEYTKTNPPETAQGAPAEFSIVGQDRVAHPAVAVWAQGGTLHYVDADGNAGTMALSAVDREATRQANAAKGLRLQVSPE